MAENDPKTDDKPAAKTSRRNRPARKAASSSNESTAIRSEKVPTAQYAGGTGWEAGNVAPSTVFVDMDGNVSDKEPKGGGHVLVAEGDVVREHMVEQLKKRKG